MTKRTTVRLPEDLLRQARRRAAAEGRTLTALIADGLRLVIAGRRKAPKLKQVMPRVSKATGGVLPCVDLTRLGLLQDVDDLDYMRPKVR
jgi:hypothetical protein